MGSSYSYSSSNSSTSDNDTSSDIIIDSDRNASRDNDASESEDQDMVDDSASHMECVICLENLLSPAENPNGNPSRKIVAASCGHIFHKVCIDNWLKGGQGTVRTCPICRKMVPPKLFRLFPSIGQDQQASPAPPSLQGAQAEQARESEEEEEEHETDVKRPRNE